MSSTYELGALENSVREADTALARWHTQPGESQEA